MCPISVSELPSEILEHILLSLPPAEIMKMREVISNDQARVPVHQLNVKVPCRSAASSWTLFMVPNTCSTASISSVLV